MPEFRASRAFALLKKAFLSTTTLVGVSALGLSTLFLMRHQSTFQRQFGLRAETLANSLAGQGQFSLLVGDRAELQETAKVALAGNEDVLYIVVEDAAGQTIAAAWRPPVTSGGLPPGQERIQHPATRYLTIRGKPTIKCVEASAPVIAMPGLLSLEPAPAKQLGRIRIGMSLEAEHAMFVRTVRYVIAIAVLLFLVACLIEHSRTRQRQAAEKIRKVEDRLRFLVSFSPSVLYSCAATEQAPVTFIGDNVREVLGYPPDDFAQPRFFWDHLHPQDEPRVRAMLAQMFQAGQRTDEYRFLHRDGVYRWIQNHARIVYDGAGRPLEIIGSLFDVTQKMQAEEARWKSELKYRELTEMLPQTVFECDWGGKLTMANQVGFQTLGLGRKDLERGVHLLDLVVPEERPRAAESLIQLLRDGEHFTHEYTLRRKDGATIPAVVYASPILSDGKPIGVRGLLIDISERRRAEEALREWAMLLESSNDAIVKRIGDSIVFWNSGAERIYGYTAGEILGRSIDELIPPEHRDELPELSSRLARGEAVANFETARVRKDGRRIDISLALTPVRDASGRLVGMVGTSRDITELKEKQRELEKRNALLELLQRSAVAANQAAAIEEAIQRCVDRICSHTGWQVGHAFLASEGPDSALVSADCWHFDDPSKFTRFRAISEKLSIERGTGLAGRVLESGAPCWVADLGADPGISRGKLATELGLKAAFASPVLAGSEVVGVLEFFSSNAPEADDPFLQAITSIGVQLGRVVERARAGGALKESEARYRAITENATHGIVTIGEEGRILYANRTSGTLFGYMPDEFFGMQVEQLIPRLACEGELTSAAKAADSFSLPAFESVGLHRSGQEMPLEISISGYLAKDNRRVCTAIVRDVSERKRAEDAVRTAHQAVRAVIQNSPLAIVTVDLGAVVESWNSAAERMFGWRSEEVVGHPFPCVPDALAGQTPDGLRRVKAGETLVFETLRQRKDGRTLEVGVWAGPIRGVDDAVTGVVVMYADLSERKALEAQLRQAQKLESIGQLAAGLAHEINTPIQYVGDNVRFVKEEFAALNRLLLAYGQLVTAAGDGPLPAELLDAARRMAERTDVDYLNQEIPKALQQSLEGIGRVAQIVRAVKEFSHPGTGERTAIDLNRAIESTILVCRNEWKYVAEVTTEFDANLPMVPCLPGEVNQVILNLIINAAQAISEVVKNTGGKGSINVSTRRDGGWAEVRVQDTGTGIPEAIRDRIFDPFFTTKEVGKGTGQGLAIAHSVVVNKHGGSIRLETEPGAGTVFIVRLPLGADEEER